MKNNAILIGMPGAGKSTVGIVLAKNLGYSFIDSDLVIQEHAHALLHEIISAHGLEYFNQLEDKVNSSIETSKSIIATGGSAVYGENAMKHFKEIGTVVYLQLSYEEIKSRLGDLKKRGVSVKQGQTLKDLYLERVPLYEKYADITVDCNNMQIREVVEKIGEFFKDDMA